MTSFNRCQIISINQSFLFFRIILAFFLFFLPHKHFRVLLIRNNAFFSSIGTCRTLLEFFSSLFIVSIMDRNHISKIIFKRILIPVIIFYVILSHFPINHTRQTKINAFIITVDCNSLRYNVTRENIERVFPNFFEFRCFLMIPLNDSRIHTSEVILWKKFSSNLLSFIDLWTYEIPKYSENNEFQWSFIFEDDVNFNDPSKVGLRNYITSLQEFMNNPDVQIKDGFFYLGICGPKYLNDTELLNTNKSLISQRSYGYCLHATGITIKRARSFWGEIASYRPNSPDLALDHQLREYSIRSKHYFYTFGSNFLYPPGTGHYGIAFQDRGRFSTTI